MARLLHIGVASLNKIENGELPPNLSIEILFQIHKHFHIRPNQLLYERFNDETK